MATRTGRHGDSAHLIPGALSALFILVAGLMATTQYLAWSYRFGPALGTPWLRGLAVPYAQNVYAPWAGAVWLARAAVRCWARTLRRAPCDQATLAALNHAHQLLLATIVVAAIGGVIASTAAAILLHYVRERKQARVPAIDPTQHSFALGIGTATGKLQGFGHGASVAPRTALCLGGDDAAKNIAIFGGIGAGKTTRAINRYASQSLHQDCGMLAFDIKGDYFQTLEGLARTAGRPVTTIGAGARPMNLLEGLTPEVAASFLKSALILAAGVNDKFWIETATELSRNVLGVLSFFPEHYSLNGLHRWLFYPDWREEMAQSIERRVLQLNEASMNDELRRLKRYLDYELTIFDKFDAKVKSNVLAQASETLSPFAQPELVDAFCTPSPECVQIETLLDGAVFLVNLPLAEFGLGAKTAYTFVKLRFFNLMQARRRRPEWNQGRTIVFLCDEYQEIVSCSKTGLSDLNFWDKSRSSGCVGIISGQSVSSFYAAIGEHDLANALLQNFRQTICFRTEDAATIDRVTRLLGQVELELESQSRQRSRTVRTGLSREGTSRSHTKGSSLSPTMRSVINPQLFRLLEPDEAIAMLTIGGAAFDDVLKMPALFA